MFSPLPSPSLLLLFLLLLLLLLSHFATPIQTLPPPPEPKKNTTLPSPPLKDWDHFTFPITFTPFSLKGRILTSRPLRPTAIHYALDGGVAKTTDDIFKYGAKTRLRDTDNPYRFAVPGCHFYIGSTLARDRQARMTYSMVRDVLFALETVVERAERWFEVSFVLVDVKQVSWGHGELMGRNPTE
ncbi:MAG: hypothetical protein Q9182_005148 [Xanthomendoza sp. 2 TL-2023]